MQRSGVLIAIVAGLCVALVGPAAAHQPSFNCNKAKKWSEMMVCNSPDLSDLDVKLDKAYRQAQQGLSAKDAAEVQQVQAAWVRGREKCRKAADPTKCLQGYYQERIQTIVQPHDNAP